MKNRYTHNTNKYIYFFGILTLILRFESKAIHLTRKHVKNTAP